MKKIINRSLSALALGAMATLAAPASATTGTVHGTVNYLQVQSTAGGGNFFVLNSTQSVGQCIKSVGKIMAMIPDDDRGKAMISVVQSALLSGKSLLVELDDKGSTAATYCYVRYIQLA